MPSVRRSRILIVDDSAIVRTMLSNALTAEPDMEVVGVAADPFVARDVIAAHKPDIVTLDLEMPRMDGLTFLRQLMAQQPLPVVIVSSMTQSGSAASIEALAAGAIDVIAKPGGPYSVADITEQLKYRIRALRAGRAVHFSRLRKPAAPAPAPSLAQAQGLIVIGASTVGTQAIEALLTKLPADAPPIVIVQHMPAYFTRAFAARLNGCCPMRVVEATDNITLERGSAYIAPGDSHLLVASRGGELRAAIGHGERVHYQRPSVDVLFRSAAALTNVRRVALLLTGMGSDGADGMVALREAGAVTIAEDERSCVVFGMPAAAIAKGGAMHVAPLTAMPRLIAQAFTGRAKAAVVQTADPSRPVFRLQS